MRTSYARISPRPNDCRFFRAIKRMSLGTNQHCRSKDLSTRPICRDTAARRAGFANAQAVSLVGYVVEHGAPDVVAALDAGALTINAAREIAWPSNHNRHLAANPVSKCRAARGT
jgi:hypothetical protein